MVAVVGLPRKRFTITLTTLGHTLCVESCPLFANKGQSHPLRDAIGSTHPDAKSDWVIRHQMMSGPGVLAHRHLGYCAGCGPETTHLAAPRGDCVVGGGFSDAVKPKLFPCCSFIMI